MSATGLAGVSSPLWNCFGLKCGAVCSGFLLFPWCACVRLLCQHSLSWWQFWIEWVFPLDTMLLCVPDWPQTSPEGGRLALAFHCLFSHVGLTGAGIQVGSAVPGSTPLLPEVVLAILFVVLFPRSFRVVVSLLYKILLSPCWKQLLPPWLSCRLTFLTWDSWFAVFSFWSNGLSLPSCFSTLS